MLKCFTQTSERKQNPQLAIRSWQLHCILRNSESKRGITSHLAEVDVIILLYRFNSVFHEKQQCWSHWTI